MPAQSSRTRRVAEQIKRDLASLVQTGLKDPRLGLLTINAVEVSADFAHAQVWFTSLATDADHASMADILNRSAGYLRRELGKGLRLRVTPELHFHYDNSIENGAHIASIIDQAIAEDQSHANTDKHDDENSNGSPDSKT